MALIKCVECGKKISKDATACPKCGAPAAKSVAAAAKPKEAGPVATGLAFGAIGLVVLFMVNRCREDEAMSARHAQQVQTEVAAAAAAPVKASSPAKPASPKTGPRKFSEADFLFDAKTRPYKSVIMKGVTRIANEDSRCRQIDPSSAYISGDRSKPGKPVFFVACGLGRSAVNVFFSSDDLKAAKPLTAPTPIDHNTAAQLCRDYARSQATNPSTLDYSVLGQQIENTNTGEVWIKTQFTAQNALGVEQKYDYQCWVSPNGSVRAEAAPAP